MSENIQNTENASIKVIDEQPILKVVSKVEKPKPKPEPEWREPDTPICGHCGRYGADGVINYCGTTFTIHQRCVSNFRDSI